MSKIKLSATNSLAVFFSCVLIAVCTHTRTQPSHCVGSSAKRAAKACKMEKAALSPWTEWQREEKEKDWDQDAQGYHASRTIAMNMFPLHMTV